MAIAVVFAMRARSNHRAVYTVFETEEPIALRDLTDTIQRLTLYKGRWAAAMQDW